MRNPSSHAQERAEKRKSHDETLVVERQRRDSIPAWGTVPGKHEKICIRGLKARCHVWAEDSGLQPSGSLLSEVLGLTAQAGMGSDLRPSCTPESSGTEGLSSYKPDLILAVPLCLRASVRELVVFYPNFAGLSNYEFSLCLRERRFWWFAIPFTLPANLNRILYKPSNLSLFRRSGPIVGWFRPSSTLAIKKSSGDPIS